MRLRLTKILEVLIKHFEYTLWKSFIKEKFSFEADQRERTSIKNSVCFAVFLLPKDSTMVRFHSPNWTFSPLIDAGV